MPAADPSRATHRTTQSRWIDEVTSSIERDYQELREQLASDGPRAVQEVGHRTESAWKNFLQDWLPPQYEVATRKYIVADSSDDARRSAETDLVIYHPSYPKRLRKESLVLASGVVGAFSVKLTLDAKGLRDACVEAAELRELLPTAPNVRDELISPIFYGVLAHSHSWDKPNSSPAANIEECLRAAAPPHPRASLDAVCVADLGCWSRASFVLLDHVLKAIRQSSGVKHDTPHLQDGYMRPEGDVTSPLGSLISAVASRLAFFDTTLKPVADGLRRLGPAEYSAMVLSRRWPLDEVFTAETRDGLWMGARSSPHWDLMYS